MHGTAFALVMIGLACGSVAVVWIYGGRPDGQAVLMGALLMVVTFLVLDFMAFGHLCLRGGPMGAVVLGAVSAGVARATVEKKAVRQWMWIGWFMLAFWGTSLCHMDGYVGYSAYGKSLAEKPLAELKHVQEFLRTAPESQKSLVLPEGWIEKSWRASTGEGFPAPATFKSGTLGRYWHTWFTGVFSLETHRCGIWCPGGPLRDCGDSLEIRRR